MRPPHEVSPGSFEMPRMISVPPAGNEADRLAALHAYHVLDTPPERAYDDIAGLAALVCHCPIALVSLVDERRQWSKARFGLAAAETPRAFSFCAHALRRKDLLVVPDAAADPRFASSPLVTGEAHIRFYAGAPLTTPDGLNLGTLCVLDRAPRALTALQREALRALARQVMTQLELRRQLLPPPDEKAQPEEGAAELAKPGGELPARNEAQADPPVVVAPAPTSLPGPGGRETVLLVEDEDSVRALALQLLQGAGYAVLEAAEGATALRVAAGHAGRIDLLLTDVKMPGMLGTELAARMRAVTPGLRVLLMSGVADSLTFRGERGEAHLLLKPFLIDAFLRKVREAIDAAP
jgi:CheY-like chemotaxis protein